MTDIGTVFPPRDEWDVLGYPIDDVVEGYRSHRVGDPVPGNNHTPGYRWGWTNAQKDRTYKEIPFDGFEAIRSAVIALEKRKC
jgi:hypothetical protein